MAAAAAATKFSPPPSSTTGHGFFFFPKSKRVPTPSPSLSLSKSSISCVTAERTRSCTRRGSRDGTLMISSSLMLTSCVKYVRPQNSLLIAFRKPSLVNKVKYRSTIKCATIEEIDGEKSLIENEAKGRMEKTLETLKASFNGVRTGRANPAMLDRVEVEYYGTPVSLKSIAQVSTPDSSTLIVQPYDKSSLKVIEKAIVNSNLDMSPNNDGEVIRLVIPPLTSDRRKELSKIVSKQSEEGKVAIRNIRRDAMKAYEKLEKEKKLSEDNVKDLSADLQKVTDEYVKKIDLLQKQKDKELLRV